MNVAKIGGLIWQVALYTKSALYFWVNENTACCFEKCIDNNNWVAKIMRYFSLKAILDLTKSNTSHITHWSWLIRLSYDVGKMSRRFGSIINSTATLFHYTNAIKKSNLARRKHSAKLLHEKDKSAQCKNLQLQYHHVKLELV